MFVLILPAVCSAFPQSMTSEAVRLLSYTLPCPLPDAPGMDSPTRSNPVNPDRLPESATSAPSVAAAAGQQLSPLIAARCNSRPPATQAQAGAEGGITTALHGLTNAIQRHSLSRESRSVNIHVSYVIDPVIRISRLPSTPPLASTPGNPYNSPHRSDNTDYFSPNVFNSIVVAPSSLCSTPTEPNPPPINPSPCLLLPPGSLHLTLLERYIPPSSPAEDAAMFSLKSSIIIDRLYELSPHGGSLLFIYPTKLGAESFERNYLGLQLDPLLRKLMVLYALHESLAWQIRRMSSTPHLADFDTLKSRLQRFCTHLSAGSSTHPRTPVKLVYAANTRISLNDFSWREWWATQEQSRIRDVVKKHLAATPKSAAQSKKETDSGASAGQKGGFWQGYGVPGDLAREVLDGVRGGEGREGVMEDAVLASSLSASGTSGLAGVGKAGGTVGHSNGGRDVEVGVFVLRRGGD